MTVYYGPGANGSGVAELVAYMNGVNYPGTFGFDTFITKCVGVVLAVVGGLTVGKEGPLAHIGANVGCAMPYLPSNSFAHLRNDVNKRELIAAGTSAGVSAAFGAPIGGTLFAYEMSKPNTFWRFSTIWRVFISCALAVFSLAFWGFLWGLPEDIAEGTKVTFDINASSLKFGEIPVISPTINVLPSCVAVGAVCGVLGAYFIIVNNWMGFFRKYYITKPWQKLCEAALFSFLITSVFFWAPYVFSGCEFVD
jgi:H+/Cl- antiporter ClcA